VSLQAKLISGICGGGGGYVLNTGVDSIMAVKSSFIVNKTLNVRITNMEARLRNHFCRGKGMSYVVLRVRVRACVCRCGCTDVAVCLRAFNLTNPACTAPP
jgi:hypothetical protein